MIKLLPRGYDEPSKSLGRDVSHPPTDYTYLICKLKLVIKSPFWKKKIPVRS